MLDKEFRPVDLEGPVGFDSLPDQQVIKAVQKGFVFNLMCIGETGIGKSTLIDSLFNTNFDSEPASHLTPAVSIKSGSYDLWEKNVLMKLTLVETVGYGDQLNKEKSYESVVEYINQQYEAYLQEELRVERCMSLYHDTRVHACLYFISPTGHGLKSLDVECMKRLDSKVNIIPIIAKADAISKTDLKSFKAKILEELLSSGIKTYKFPDDDETIAETNIAMNEHIPFAVVGSSEFIRVGNKTVRGRQYPWGSVQVDNDAHCDTAKLREMMIRTNMEDLRDSTHCVHYELYRKNRLEEMGFDGVHEIRPLNLQEAFKEKIMKQAEEWCRIEDELREAFILKTQKAEANLECEERKIREKFESTEQLIHTERKALEDNILQLHDEMNEFHKLKAEYEADLSPGKKPSGFHQTFSLGSLKGKKK